MWCSLFGAHSIGLTARTGIRDTSLWAACGKASPARIRFANRPVSSPVMPMVGPVAAGLQAFLESSTMVGRQAAPPEEVCTMKVLALEKDQPDASPWDFEPHLKEEARMVWQLLQSGTIRDIHFRDDREEAIIILEVHDTTEAARVLGQLPLVKAGLAEFEIIGLRPYSGFSRLFKKE